MKLKTILYAAAATITLAACSNDTDNESNALQALQVQADIASTTRVANGAFEKDDAIGVHVVSTATDGLTSGSNVKYVAQDASGNFTSDTPVYYKDKNDVNIYAYYPYTEELSGNVATVKIADQTDWLYAKAEGITYNTATQALTFDHVLTKFILTLKVGTGITDLKALTSITLKNLGSEGTFNTQTGVIATTTSADYSVPVTTISEGTTEQSYTLLILPVSGTANAPAEIPVEILYDDATYSVTLQASSGLEAGKSYSYTVNLTRNGLTVGSSLITDWSDANLDEDDYSAEIQPEETERTEGE
jgi:hypothetical protein